MKATKNKVYLSKMKVEGKYILVLQHGQKVNRETTFYYAERVINNTNESVFFIVRIKDAKFLKSKGFSIQSIDVPKNNYPVAIDYSSGTILKTRWY